VELRRRWHVASPAARTRGHADDRRAASASERFKDRTKRSVAADADLARELAGWCRSLAVLDE
jgi:hypothetical protein